MDIWTAILRPCYGRAKALIRGGADLTVVGPAGDTSLRLALRLGPADMVRLLLKAGAGPNSDPGFPLNAACANGRLSSVKALLKAGANVNRIHPLTSTPLMYAVLKQHPDIVSLLRRNGADINATNAAGSFASSCITGPPPWDLLLDTTRGRFMRDYPNTAHAQSLFRSFYSSRSCSAPWSLRDSMSSG
ncbi:hypothetical protein V2G26_009497 [Clonostachys chloroleuca]